MKIWCVDHASLSSNIHSELFFTKEEAEAEFDRHDANHCYCKMYQVVDIWGWCARNFGQVILEILASRDDGDSRVYICGMCNEIKEAATHCGLAQCSVEGFWTDEDEFVLSVAWVSNNELNHRTWDLLARDDAYNYPTIVERRSKWQK